MNTLPHLEPSLDCSQQPRIPIPTHPNVLTPYKFTYQSVLAILRLFPQVKVDPNESSCVGVAGYGVDYIEEETG
jgi:hypothetical protein